MYSHLRRCEAHFTPELACGCLPSHQHCLLASATTMRAPNRAVTCAPDSAVMCAQDTGDTCALDCEVKPQDLEVTPAQYSAGPHASDGERLGATDSEGSYVPGRVVTRLIFPLVDGELGKLTLLLLAQYWGHQEWCSCFALHPELTYSKLHTPRDGVAPVVSPVFSGAEPSLMVRSVALNPAEHRYEQPYLTFETPCDDAITCRLESDFCPGPLFYSCISHTFYPSVLGPRSRADDLPGKNRCGEQRWAQSSLALALSSLRRPGPLVQPTPLELNHALELCLNPDGIGPRYGAFLTHNQLCFPLEVALSERHWPSFMTSQAYQRSVTQLQAKAQPQGHSAQFLGQLVLLHGTSACGSRRCA